MSYISNKANIYETSLTWRNKEEETMIRDSKEVKRSVERVRNGKEDAKKYNYYRLVNGTSNEPIAYRQDGMLEDSGKLLLDYDVKDSVNHKYRNVEKIFKPHIKDWGIVHMEESARGGAHITVRKIEGLNERQMLDLFDMRTGLKADRNGLNLCKACFLVPNSFVHYVDDELYYTKEPTPRLTLTESEQLEFEHYLREQEIIHQDEVKARRENAELFISSSSDSETLDLLIKKIDESGADIIRHDYDRWVNVGLCIAGIQGRAGLRNFLTLSRYYDSYTQSYAIDKYERLCRETRGELHLGSLIMYAREEGVIL